MMNEKCVDECNKLLRGELSAVETYNQALEKFSKDSQGPKLKNIKADHEKSVSKLKANIEKMGGMPSDESGIWGEFAKIVQGGAKLFGVNTALSALKQGEEHGQKLYESALNNVDVMDECKAMIREELLAMQVKHITEIDLLVTN